MRFAGASAVRRYTTGVVCSRPLLAPFVVSSSIGEPSKLPPTLPSLVRNSSMTEELKSLAAVMEAPKIGIRQNTASGVQQRACADASRRPHNASDGDRPD